MKNLKINLQLLMIVIAPFALQSCIDGKSATNAIPKASEPIPVKVLQLQKTTNNSVITASGQLTAEDETLLAFKTGGVVNKVFVKEGDQVRTGQLLASLDLTEINSTVAQAQHNVEKVQRDFQRVSNLYKDSVATLEQLQNVETALSVAKEQLQAATFNKSFSTIHAPANGYVLRKFVNAGQVVGVGDPILLTNSASQGAWILKVGVSDKEWSSVRIGDRATVKLDAFNEKTFNSAVIRKSETADPQTGAFTIELQLRNDGVRLATGMFGAATIQSAEKHSSWSVPYEAVLDANGNDAYVFVTSDNKTATKQPVKIESFNGTSMLISSGLENAEALIVSGSAYLSHNSPIIIQK
jgi:RND family efflux transporter MFP subunit